jgi:hypothetical protein
MQTPHVLFASGHVPLVPYAYSRFCMDVSPVSNLTVQSDACVLSQSYVPVQSGQHPQWPAYFGLVAHRHSAVDPGWTDKL